MLDMMHRLVWFFIVACASAYGVFLVLGATIQARALEESRAVVARDVLQPGQHSLSGIVMVPKTCAQLSVQTEQISEVHYVLHFKTWEEPSVACNVEDTARSFRAQVFAPAAGVTFTGDLDGEPLVLTVIPAVNIRDHI